MADRQIGSDRPDSDKQAGEQSMGRARDGVLSSRVAQRPRSCLADAGMSSKPRRARVQDLAEVPLAAVAGLVDDLPRVLPGVRGMRRPQEKVASK